ncbi:molybdopterin-dependent oxidoreductase [Methanococcoides sp. FTZ1]|uniref:molybdopterin-dependent oxidoreductase n=1 Tax=Methanococcoides sp. FTZ1 TaxID=3439061 RepID=UPI003F84742B
MTSGCISSENGDAGDGTYNGEVEALEYEGVKLTPISEQRDNSIKGTPQINTNTYFLTIDGMVDDPQYLTYEQVTSYPDVSKVVMLDCVEGWSYVAKWTGIPVKTLLDEAGVQDGATTVIFHSADGYSTALELDYLVENNIILGYRLNDVTLPKDHGYPFQLVAEGKYGYKWAKWVTGIEVTDELYEGYWESRGYNNNADVGGPRFG